MILNSSTDALYFSGVPRVGGGDPMSGFKPVEGG